MIASWELPFCGLILLILFFYISRKLICWLKTHLIFLIKHSLSTLYICGWQDGQVAQYDSWQMWKVLLGNSRGLLPSLPKIWVHFKNALSDIILHLSQLHLRGGQHSPLFLTPIPRTSEVRLNRRAGGKLNEGAQERLLLTRQNNETAAQTLHTLLSCLEWKLFHLPRHFCWAGWVVFSRKKFSRISDSWLLALQSFKFERLGPGQ